ncbi:MAG: matrixin family metalloprotease [Verrucomicrobia bacterium]|nr:MAG: matrixin family metalloprotease [Verrucomicrobiota bacterium]
MSGFYRFVLLVWCTGWAWGFVPYIDGDGNVLRWNLAGVVYDSRLVNPITKAIRYYLATDAWSAGNRDAELNAVRASFAQWQAVPGTSLRFEDAGLAPKAEVIASGDKTNLVFWAKKTRLVGGVDLTNLRGYTLLELDAENNILEADIVLNGLDFSWFTSITNTRSAEQFVEAVVLHEVGHFIGLDHTPVGGGTVIPAANGVSTSVGLSVDEIAGVRFLYPLESFRSQLGTIGGRVMAGAVGVFGAAVFAETLQGNIAAGTISGADGSYRLPALPVGSYELRATPLDPVTATEQYSLFRGRDIAADYVGANTSFRPSAQLSAVVVSLQTNTVNIPVVAGLPPLRIFGVNNPNTIPGAETRDRTAVKVELGRQNFYIGIASTNVTPGTTLSVTGDGITVGPTQFLTNRFSNNTHALVAFASVAANATPGLRSFVVRRGADVAYANGYLEILPAFPDDNFDGLDDFFQRQFFPLWTAANAAPGFDADGDGFSNQFEAATGSNPTVAGSVSFLIRSVKMTSQGSKIEWRSDLGRRYQIYSRPELSLKQPWKELGSPVTATGDVSTYQDTSSPGVVKFYRLQLLPL